MTKITIHSILLLPPSSLLLPVSWTPGSICESWNVIHTSSLHHCLPFLISSPFPSFPPPIPPVCRGDRVIRMWAVVSYPIHFFFFFYLRFPRINSPVAHPTQPINFFPPCPMPALVVFEGKKKKKKKSQLESLVTSIERASSPATHPPAPSPRYLGSASSFWLGHLTTAITLYDFI